MKMQNRPLSVLTATVFTLAVFAVLLGERPREGVVEVDLRTLAGQIDTEEDHLGKSEVEARLSSGVALQVIDLRDSSSFRMSHIPGAQNATVSTLLDLPLSHDIPVLLYSEGGLHSVQAWMLLKAKGFDEVYTLRGGWRTWSGEGATNYETKNVTPAGPKPKTKQQPEREKLPWEC